MKAAWLITWDGICEGDDDNAAGHVGQGTLNTSEKQYSFKLYDDDERLCGERRFVGLYTAAATRTSPSRIPLLRRKLQEVVKRAAFHPNRESTPTESPARVTVPRNSRLALFRINAALSTRS